MELLRTQPRRRWWPKVLIVVLISVFIVVCVGVVALRHIYMENLKPASPSQRTITLTIPLNSSVHQISTQLKAAGLIRSDWAFEWYVRSAEVGNQLQAGTYSLRPSQSVQDIVLSLTQGKVATDMITILPGQRLDQIRQAFIQAGFNEQAVDAALDPTLYDGHPALVDKPRGANLEGYLYPETFQKDAQTKPEDIVRASLDQLQKYLTPELRAALNKQGLSVHEGIILASIVEQEVSKQEDRPQVAQVFMKRFRENMPLGSDVTAIYGAIVAGQKPPSLTYDSPYNTHYHAGLPPGPISNVTTSALRAVAYPASTDWLYFVSGDDGITYFSKTLQEHEALTAAHCKKLCSAQ